MQLLMLCLQFNKRSKDTDLVLLFQYKQPNQSQMFFNKEIVLTGILKFLSLKVLSYPQFDLFQRLLECMLTTLQSSFKYIFIEPGKHLLNIPLNVIVMLGLHSSKHVVYYYTLVEGWPMMPRF